MQLFVRRADSLAFSLRSLGFKSNSILSGHTQLKMLVVQPLCYSEMDSCFSYTARDPALIGNRGGTTGGSNSQRLPAFKIIQGSLCRLDI